MVPQKVSFGETPPRVRSLDQEDSLRLIREVEKHPCLWHQQAEDYGDAVKKEQRWVLIAQRLEMAVDEAKERWKRLLAARKNAMLRREDAITPPKAKWKFEDEMSFLRPQLSSDTAKAPTRSKRQRNGHNETNNGGAVEKEKESTNAEKILEIKEEPNDDDISNASTNRSMFNTKSQCSEKSVTEPEEGRGKPAPKRDCPGDNVSDEIDRIFSKKSKFIKTILSALDEDSQRRVLPSIEKSVSEAIIRCLSDYT